MSEETVEKKIILKEEDDYIVNMGPQHPSTHGVLRLEVCLSGETVNYMIPHIGYIHRGIEKMAESDTYKQVIHLTDRMDYLSSHINNEAVCLAVEEALGVEVPERVQYIRAILDELTRIASHNLWWSAFGMDLGALTTFFYGMRDREKILSIFEESFGSRLLHSFNTPGGLLHDVHPDFRKHTLEYVKYFRKKLPDYKNLLTDNVIFHNRTIGIGVMDKKMAINYGVTGPSGRGSGFSCDIRKAAPYGIYDKVKFKEILYHEGDSFARYKVRMDEMVESLNILEQLVDNMPEEGGFTAKMKPVIKLPEGEYYQRVETARGELGVYIVSKGAKYPYRIKFRSPNFSNLFVLNTLSKGGIIADLVAICGSLDLVIPDIDR
ncbi:MAG TPA: NADH-quinone oxidoreductase subunit D [Bacteroidetes bacterium]|nr:NADH-quinone oxidoreductase subunit D [Bacteroidota bacterium]